MGAHFLPLVILKGIIFKRTNLAVLLFACLIAPLASSYMVFQLHRNTIRDELKVMIMNGKTNVSLVKFEFTNTQEKNLIKWENLNEFEYRGEMYDVVFAQRFSGSVSYLCWKDNKETKLKSQIMEVWNNQSESNECQKRIIKFFDSLFWSEICQFNFIKPFEQPSLFREHLHFYNVFQLKSEGPPPRRIL